VRPVITAAAKLVGLAVAIYLLVFYLRLGLVLHIVLPMTALVAIAVTVAEWRGRQFPAARIMTVLLGYALVQTLIFWAATTTTEAPFTMLWSRGTSEALPDPLVVLEFEDFPGNVVRISSVELLNHLVASGEESVLVRFEVTRDIGCMVGFRTAEVAGLRSWSTEGGGSAGSVGNVRSPWREPWWCP
jgi:hypothetical protein